MLRIIYTFLWARNDGKTEDFIVGFITDINSIVVFCELDKQKFVSYEEIT